LTSDESTQSPSNDADGPEDEKSGWAKAGIGMALGFEFVGFIAVGILLGRWIDQRLGTEPIALLVGMLVAIVAASLHIYQMANRLMRSDDGA